MAEKITIEPDSSAVNEMLRNLRTAMNDAIKNASPDKLANFAQLRKTMESLMGQQNIQLRSIERSGRVHDARMKEWDRYFAGVEKNIRLRANLREKGDGGGGSAPVTGTANWLLGKGGRSPLGSGTKGIEDLEKKITGKFKEIYQFQQDEAKLKQENMPQDVGAEGKRKSLKGTPGGGMLNPFEQQTKKMTGIGKMLNNRMGGLIKKSGDFMTKTPLGKGMMAGGMAGAGILGMVIKKAIEASPMLQAMLKIVNMAILLWLRPIGDFFGFMFKPIAMYLLRASMQGLKDITKMQEMGSEFGRKLLAFFLNPMEIISQAIWGGGNHEKFMTTVDNVIKEAYAKLGGGWDKSLSRFQKKVAGGGTGYAVEVPAELSGLLHGMEARYGEYSQEIESWLSKAVPIFEEFAIVVPEEMLVAWEYYERQVDAGTMTMSQVMRTMNMSIASLTTQGTGAFEGIVVYTEELQSKILAFRDKLQSATSEFGVVAGGFVVNMDGEFVNLVTGTKTAADKFVGEFGTALDDLSESTTKSTQETGVTLNENSGNLSDWWDSFWGKGDTSATGKGNLGDAHAHTEKILSDAMKGATNTKQIEQNVITAAQKTGATAEVIGLARDFLEGNVDMTKYFGEGFRYGDIGGTYGYNYSNITSEQVADQMGIPILTDGDRNAMAANILDGLMIKQTDTGMASDSRYVQAVNAGKIGDVSNAMLSIAQASPNSPANALAALAKSMGAGTGGIQTAEGLAAYNALVGTGMSASEALAVAAETSGSGGGNQGTTSGGDTGGGDTGGGDTGGGDTGGGDTGGGDTGGDTGGGYSGTGRKHALGGWITEPILGIGQRSGNKYSFGEGGRDEFISPGHTMSGDNGGGMSINFYIDKIEKEVDLEDLQRKIERAILEVHSRRGII